MGARPGWIFTGNTSPLDWPSFESFHGKSGMYSAFFIPTAWKLSTMATCQNLRTTGFWTLKTKLNRSVSLSIHLEFHLHFHIYWMGSLRTLSRPWIFVPGVCNSYVRATNKKGEIGSKICSKSIVLCVFLPKIRQDLNVILRIWSQNPISIDWTWSRTRSNQPAQRLPVEISSRGSLSRQNSVQFSKNEIGCCCTDGAEAV